MELFADFQGFKDCNNEFIVKEFAVATADATVLQHWTVRSPCPYVTLDMKAKKQCTWTTEHYHGIRWQDGDVTIQALHRQLYPILNDSVVYIKGLEKANYIKEFFTPCMVTDLEHYPSLKTLTTPNVYCFLHGKSKMMCALNNVLKLVQYHNHLIKSSTVCGSSSFLREQPQQQHRPNEYLSKEEEEELSFTMDNTDLKSRLNNCNVPQYTRISDLRPGIPYKITHFSKSQTRYGEAICATLEGIADDDVLLNVYLPRRFLTILNDVTIESYNSGEADRMSLLYRGFGKGIEFV